MIIGNGYLAKHLINDNVLEIKKNNNIYEIISDDLLKSIKDFEDVYFFASPIEIKNIDDFNNSYTSLISLMKIVDYCKIHNNKLIFASSMAVIYDNTEYSCIKKLQENYIQKLENYLIFRFPRTYSKDRTKGLIPKLQNNEIQYLNDFVRYSDIEDVKFWFNNNLKNNGIINYDYKENLDTLFSIKNKYPKVK